VCPDPDTAFSPSATVRSLRAALGSARLLPVGVDPRCDLGGVEAQEVAPLSDGDAAFMDDASDVADVDAEDAGDLGEGEQPIGERRRGGFDVFDITDSLQHLTG